jgi:hypothetical protein
MEELAYRRILDLIVVTGDRLRDDDRALAWVTKAGRAWNRVKARLLELGKITVEDGFVRNRRATEECSQSLCFIAQRSAAGHASAERRKSLKNKDRASPAVGAAVPTAEATGAAANQESQPPSLQEGVSPLSAPDGTDIPRGNERSADLFAGAAPSAKPPRIRRVKPELPAATLHEAAAIWNEMAAERRLPQVSDLTERRTRRLRALLARQLGGDLGRWRAYLAAIGSSSFLTGGGPRGWRADFDWALREDNLVAVREGKFDDDTETA